MEIVREGGRTRGRRLFTKPCPLRWPKGLAYGSSWLGQCLCLSDCWRVCVCVWVGVLGYINLILQYYQAILFQTVAFQFLSSPLCYMLWFASLLNKRRYITTQREIPSNRPIRAGLRSFGAIGSTHLVVPVLVHALTCCHLLPLQYFGLYSVQQKCSGRRFASTKITKMTNHTPILQ